MQTMRASILNNQAKYFLTLLSLIFCCAVSADEQSAEDFFNQPKPEYAQPNNLLGWIDGRNIESLNGEWKYIVDPLRNGLPGESFFSDFPSNKLPQSEYELVEYDFANASSINVPGDWNSQKENLFFYQGGIWYYKEFEYKKAKDELVHLYFEGSNFSTKVFLNGKSIGGFDAGYTSFDFEVTEAINDGPNYLMVFVDAALDSNTVPTQKTDWWLYGGLVGDVLLVRLPQAHIQNAKVQLNKYDPKKIDIHIIGNELLSGESIVLSIPELGIKKEYSLNDDAEARDQIPFTGQHWDIGSPKLYKVILESKDESIQESIGFRTIATKGSEIYLNKKPIKLKGISSHAEPIGLKGFAFSSEHFKSILAEVSKLGGNFLRAAHYPYSRHLAKEADNAGILLWEEIPVYWNINWQNNQAFETASQQLVRMISRDWNRASVAIWSVGNETPYSESRMEFLTGLIDNARALDDSRLVSAALLGGSAKDFQNLILAIASLGLESEIPTPTEKLILKGLIEKLAKQNNALKELTITLDDPIGQYLDIVALNEYFGWYYSVFLAPQIQISEKTFRLLMLELLPEIRIKNVFSKPIHLSEFGAGAKFGKSGEGIWTESYQAMVYKAQIAMIKNNPDTIQGYSPWILKDFRSMMRPLAGIQDYYNRKGLMDENGNKKEAYYYLQKFYETGQ